MPSLVLTQTHQTWSLRLIASCVGMALTAGNVSAEDVDYLRHVKPLLEQKCYSCHSARKQEGGLRLDAAVLIKEGGDNGPVIEVEKPAASYLLERVTAGEDERMPPPESGSRLTSDEIVVLRQWIAAGALAPEEPIPAPPTEHWAFQQPQRSEPPSVRASWVRNPVDQFLAAQQQRVGATAVGETSQAMLLRRASITLTGLPPTRDELLAFLDNPSPNAYEEAVDRLLESPRYGERWARHFMDIWRYSDPSGYGKEIRDGRQHIWRWRDWIVASLNEDKGYDRMVQEMLAADELAPGDSDALRATGFLARNWYKFNRNLWLDNIVEHSAKAFLGLTVNCAKCHEHKYDPIEQTDYYQLRAFFETHDVRDDAIPSATALGAGPNMLVRAYDAHLDRPTFRFVRGDENRPDKDRPVEPGLPQVLDGGSLDIQPVALPVTAWYPALRADRRAAAIQSAEEQVAAAKKALQAAASATGTAKKALAAYQEEAPKATSSTAATPDRKPQPPRLEPILEDEFATLSENDWHVESGDWKINNGRLVQSAGASQQHRVISTIDHPRNFRATAKLRITGGDVYKSVGIGFDGHGRAMNSVYVSFSGQKVQFSTQGDNGVWQYPQDALAAHRLEEGKDYALEIAVRDQLLNVLIDGELQVAYVIPAQRKPGKFSLYAFSATADFDRFQIAPLEPNVMLSQAMGDASPKNKPKTREDYILAVRVAEAAEVAAKAKLETALAEQVSLNARIEAELIKHELQEGDYPATAKSAGLAERKLKVAQLEQQITDSRSKLLQGEQSPPADAKGKQALQQVKANLPKLQQQVTAAREALESESVTYALLGPQYPRTSSGRRLAYARWITSDDNPFAARVLVNHVWLRHFDRPLIERTFDLGLRSDKPRHAGLLDWLALKVIEDDWSLKQLHKLILTSGAFRLSSSASEGTPETRANDPDNATYWRMNTRRMEAEVVRDSVLHLGGSLDVTMGGPPVEHTLGQSVLRRSIYFRQDKERQMTFLSLFDGAKVNECYQRKATVAPQQALAMFNSAIAAQQAKKITDRFAGSSGESYVRNLFEHLLCRPPSADEVAQCTAYLTSFKQGMEARRQLALVLLNHNDFVTIR